MNYNKMIDHTVLKADTPLETIKRICDEAMEYGQCMYSYWFSIRG